MDSGNEKQNLRKKLAIAVRSIQWSYGIFWSISSTQPGALEWGEGYYNGDIKTRKTVQAAESKTDQLGLQRSEQLRELYESLSLGENNPQAIKRPTAALSPEDLTDAEWYFLVCMSFVFNADQGLPGRTLSKNQTIWLCNAGHADTKVFSRSLLAKSASIQTIVCFPYFGGVFELGATELVPEDPNLVQHVITSFLDSPSGSFSNVPNYVCQVLDHASLEEDLDQLLDCPNMDIFSPDNFSDDFADNLLRDESNLFEGDDISNCLNNSTNSSDCISQTHEDQNQECNNQQNNPSVLQGNNDDVHYQSVLSNLLKSSQQLIFGPYFGNGSRESSFVCWRKNGLSGSQVNQSGNIQQKLLKKVLVEVGKMHENGRMKQNRNSKTEADEIDRNHVLSERKRREKINERFTILGSLVPSGGKVDKISILDNTIEYLRELERKIKDLESTTQSKPHDAVERTSDNYGPNKTGNITKKPSANKRKACEVEKMGPDNISVSVSGKDVSIELTCCEKEGVLLEVVEAIRKLRMDTQNVHSSNSDGILNMTIKAKYKGLKGASAGMITQALQKIIRKC